MPKYRVSLYVLRHEEGGRTKPFCAGYKATFHFNGIGGSCGLYKVDGYAGHDEIPQGVEHDAEVWLFTARSPAPAVGDTFELREGERVSAKGKIAAVLGDS
ncbi:MAG: hypothetical protein ACKVP0_09315 [Pirellulaceae bacterium]